jgi:hypothetical protein
VFLKDVEDVSAEEGLTPGNGNEIDAQFLGLVENPIDDLETQFFFLLITTGITAKTFQVAAHGWAKDEESRGIEAPRFVGICFPFVGSHQELIYDIALNYGFAVVRIESSKYSFGNFQARMSLIEKVADPANPTNVVIPLS